MNTEKLIRSYERDPSYVFLLFMALVGLLALAIFTGCHDIGSDLPQYTGNSDNYTDNAEACIQTNPVHVCSLPGDYSVTLSVTGETGEAQISREDYVQVRTPDVDLAVTELSTLGVRLEAGDSVELIAVVQNRGICNACDCRISVFLSSDMTVSEDDAAIFDGPVGPVCAESSTVVTMVGTIPEATSIGFYTPLVHITVPESVNDCNDSNNTYAPDFQFTIFQAVKIAAVSDTFVSSDLPHDMLGDLPVLTSTNLVDEESYSRTQIEFDMENSGIGSNARIASAELRLYAISTTAGDSEDLGVFAIAEAWDEDTCSWECRPCLESESSACYCVPRIGWTSIDITDLAQGWLEGSRVNNGLALSAQSAESAFAFYSRECDISVYRPSLEIELEPSSP